MIFRQKSFSSKKSLLFKGFNELDEDLLRKNFSIIFFLTSKATLLISTFLLFTELVIYGTGYHNWLEFAFFGIPWSWIYVYYANNLANLIYMLATYIYTIRIVIRLRLKKITNILTVEHRLLSQLRSITQILTRLNQYDLFWKHFVSIYAINRLFIINFILYIYLFQNVHKMILYEYFMVGGFETIGLFFTIHQASSISVDLQAMRKKMNESLGEKINFRNKLKVLMCFTLQRKK